MPNLIQCPDQANEYQWFSFHCSKMGRTSTFTPGCSSSQAGYFMLEAIRGLLFHLFICFKERENDVKSIVCIQILPFLLTFQKVNHLPGIISSFLKRGNDTILSGIKLERMVLLKYLAQYLSHSKHLKYELYNANNYCYFNIQVIIYS